MVEKTKLKSKSGTFVLNKNNKLHSWYPYMEGYSAQLVNNVLDELSDKGIKTLYDPFGGTGTTPLVASERGIISYYSESNPFMEKVIETKINCVKNICGSKDKINLLHKYYEKLKKLEISKKTVDVSWGDFIRFFEHEKLVELLNIKLYISTILDKDCKSIFMLALSSILVLSSKMIRRGDLRFAKENEKKEFRSPMELMIDKLNVIIQDIEDVGLNIKKYAIKASDDARYMSLKNEIDCIITSPPYLNGTNYIRNTKLELKLNDFIGNESDLAGFHSKGIRAGINNISKRNKKHEISPLVKEYIDKLEPVSYDKRIQLMIAGYFYDMDDVIKKLSEALKDRGYFIMDIGDSQFAGVHIPTHEILIKICQNHGFELYEQEILRERKSKNGMILTQRVLKFILKKDNTPEIFKEKAINFVEAMPYKKEPYNSRNWGHSWHSLCSYHGKLKPAIAHVLVDRFSNVGDVVLDPLSGVGTIPFEACLQGRKGIANDLSEMAYVVSKAKLEKPLYENVLQVIDHLKKYLEENLECKKIDILVEKYKNFGFNGKLPEYFHEDTFKEILCLREYFISKIQDLSSSEALVFSSFLHVLHGNRPYALSRNSHSLTPYKPKGDFIYKNVLAHIENKINLVFKKGSFDGYIKGKSFLGDYEKISEYHLNVDIIISSPPFADSIKFYMQNWMRLWLCGWEQEKFNIAKELFLDVKQKKDFSIYNSFFKMCNDVLKPKGKVILHLGKTKKVDMAYELSKYAESYFDIIYKGDEVVSELEKHGVKDKGGVTEHQYLFLMKKS